MFVFVYVFMYLYVSCMFQYVFDVQTIPNRVQKTRSKLFMGSATVNVTSKPKISEVLLT